MTPKSGSSRPISENRRARHDYTLLENFEAGIQLMGSEVKALRNGRANIAESYIAVDDNELFLINCHIPEYHQANRLNHDPRRKRRLLMHRREITRLDIGVARKGLTIVPLRFYFNAKGYVKLTLALAQGRKLHDKRQEQKNRDWQRDQARLLRQR